MRLGIFSKVKNEPVFNRKEKTQIERVKCVCNWNLKKANPQRRIKREMKKFNQFKHRKYMNSQTKNDKIVLINLGTK